MKIKSIYRIVCTALMMAVISSGAKASELMSQETEPKDTAVSIQKGKYIFIPDSLQNDVMTLLMGNSKVVDDESKYDSTEKVIWKGDTIPMKLRTRNLGRYDRGLFNYLFVPKGNWSLGATVSYGELSTDDMELFDLLTDIDLGGHIFAIKPYVEYFIGNNISCGLRFGYTTGKAHVDSFKVDIDEDMNFNLHDIAYGSESYSAALFFRQYIGISRRGRFGVFNEAELSFASGNSDFTRPYDGKPRTTHTTSASIALNFSPGVSVFIMKNAAFNLSLGVFGLHIKSEKQTENGVQTGNRTTSGANFRFNIFNINFGIAIHL